MIELNNYNEWREKYIWKIYWWKSKEILIFSFIIIFII